MASSQPLLPIALTMGDPSGIGPEIAVKAWAAGERFVWIGDPRHLPEGTDWREVSEGEAPGDGTLAVLRQDFALVLQKIDNFHLPIPIRFKACKEV